MAKAVTTPVVFGNRRPNPAMHVDGKEEENEENDNMARQTLKSDLGL